jgi:tripartite-type tricarboxylate transporter receptor subunit TctC
MYRMRAHWRCVAVTGALLGCAVSAAVASDYPSRPITITVPFAAGGSTDVAMRVIGQKMTELLGQPLVIENRGGAGGRIGAEIASRATPDGYSLSMVNTATHGIIPVTTAKPGYDPLTGHTPIVPLASYPLVLVCNPKVPARNVQELIAYAQANPGKLNYSTPGAGGQGHFAWAFFLARAKIQMVHVPYRGGGPSLQDLVAGVVDCAFNGAAKTYIDSGAVKALAVSRAVRDPMYPDVPTLEEVGLRGLDMLTWMGLAGPPGVAPEIVAKLNAVANTALKDQQVIDGLFRSGNLPLGGTPHDLLKIIESDLGMYRRIAEEAGIRAE